MNEESLSCKSFLTLTALLSCLWLLTRKLFSTGSNKNNLPPSPPQLPIVGNLHQLHTLPHRPLHSLSTKYGPLMFLRLGSKPALVISSAAVAKQAFKNHDVSFSGKAELIATKRLYKTSKGMLILPYGDRWKELRRILVAEIFNTKKFKRFNTVLNEETSILVENVKKFCLNSTPVNISEMFMSLTGDVICKMAFGKKYSEMKEGQRTLEVMNKVGQLLMKFSVGEFIPWLAWIDRLTGSRAELDRVLELKDELVEIGIRELQESSKADGCRENIIDVLLGLHRGDTPGVYMDWDTVKAVIQDVFGAGTQSSGITLEWAMTEIMRNPEILRKLQNETQEVMNGRQDITDLDLDKMRYLKAVIKETFRFHPPLPIVPRATTEAVKFMGYDIPDRTMVMFNVWAMGQDPACWDEPEKFMPERFLYSSVDYKGFDFQYIPFGAGRRICPGISMGTFNVEYVLANLMLKFDWELPSGMRGEELDVSEKPGFVVGRNTPLVVVPTKYHF